MPWEDEEEEMTKSVSMVYRGRYISRKPDMQITFNKDHILLVHLNSIYTFNVAAHLSEANNCDSVLVHALKDFEKFEVEANFGIVQIQHIGEGRSALVLEDNYRQ